jgi:hypothetical protein
MPAATRARWPASCWSNATYELLRELFTPEQWAALARSTLEPVPGLDPPFELFDVSRSW